MIPRRDGGGGGGGEEETQQPQQQQQQQQPVDDFCRRRTDFRLRVTENAGLFSNEFQINV